MYTQFSIIQIVWQHFASLYTQSTFRLVGILIDGLKTRQFLNLQNYNQLIKNGIRFIF